jgi:hypothetical protein
MIHRAPVRTLLNVVSENRSNRCDDTLQSLNLFTQRGIAVKDRTDLPTPSPALSRTLELTALLTQFVSEKPSISEIDDITRTARKLLVETRNLRTKDRANPSLVVAVFDQVSHALTRFAGDGANHRLIAIDAAMAAAHSCRSAHLAPEVMAAGIEQLLYDAAAVLAQTGASLAQTDAKKAAIWLLAATEGLVKHAPEAARLSARRSEENTQHVPVRPAKSSGSLTHETMQTEVVMKPQTEKNPMLEKIQLEATDAAWRTAGSQFVKLTREPLVGLLTRHLSPDDDAFRARAAAFLETELGGAILASVLSAALSALPATAGEVPQKLARELRVRAMSDTGDVLADLLMGPLRQVIALYLQDAGALNGASHSTAAPTVNALPQGGQVGLIAEQARERSPVER